MSRRVVLAMSGGVDSSASAVLLKEQGYEVIGLFMRSGATEEQWCSTDLPILNSGSSKQGCCSASDAADARRVADLLDIPFHALNFQSEFGQIQDYFVREYLNGRTPNPCVQCNNWLKFGRLWEFAQGIGAESIATGHYARVEGDSLRRGLDAKKDQSYVLFGLNKELLANTLFPVGGHQKGEIRELAARAGLRNAQKPDSQEICFIPDQDYAGFIRRYHGEVDTAGDFVDTAGTVLGQHKGFEQFTVGQRKGLGIAFGEPRFVVRVEPETHRVVIGTRADLDQTELVASGANWLDESLPGEFRCEAQIRYQHQAAPASVTQIDPDHFRVRFDHSQFAIAPGQAVVLYEGDRVLGGGWIDRNDNFEENS